jgi:hypothetical protein
MSGRIGSAVAHPHSVVGGIVTVLALTIVALILNANVFSDITDAYKYARLDIPGSTVVQLPRGRLEVILEDPLGNGVDVPRDLSASIVPVGGGPAVPLTRDVGGQFGASGNRQDTGDDFRRVWSASVPVSGSYRFTASGGGSDSGFSLDLGHGPPISSAAIWAIVGIAEASLVLVWLLARTLRRRRRPVRADSGQGTGS